MSELTRAIMRYKETGTGFEEIRARLYLLIYDYPKARRRLDSDVCGNFLIYMMPRIESLIERYRRETVAFEGYLNVCLRWRLKSFLRHEKTLQTRSAREVDPYVWQDINEDAYAEEPAAAYNASITLKSALEVPSSQLPQSPYRKLREFNARNKGLLFFCLKAICDVDDLKLPSVARLCGVSYEWLAESREILTGKTTKRRKRLSRLRTRQETLYSRLRDAQERLVTEAEPERKNELRSLIRNLSCAYRKASHEAGHTNLRPSNYDIAELLHVPKGTVDSGIARARQVLSSSLIDHRRQAAGSGTGKPAGRQSV